MSWLAGMIFQPFRPPTEGFIENFNSWPGFEDVGVPHRRGVPPEIQMNNSGPLLQSLVVLEEAYFTPARTLSISVLKFQVLELPILS